MTTVELRQWRVTRLPIMKCDISMAPEVLKRRVDEHIKELAADIPALKNLQASRLETVYETQTAGLYLKVFIEELPQLSLLLHSARSAGSELTDLFLQDVDRIKSDQGKIRQRRIQAQNPAIDPFEDGQISTVRKRMRKVRCRGETLIPTGPEPEQCRHDDLARVLPRGDEIVVIASVKWLSPLAAQVLVHSVIDFEGDGVCRLAPDTVIELRRIQRHRRQESGGRLQQAMDTRRQLKLRVSMAFDWASGDPKHLELVDFLGDVEEDADSDRRS
jgi:hypothetical protein